MVSRIVEVMAVTVLALAGSACSGSASSGGAPRPTTTVAGTVAGSSVPEPQPRAQTGSARLAVCDTDYRTVQTSVKLFRAGESAEPTSIRDLVPMYLHQTPSRWMIEIGPDGVAQILPTPAGVAAGCTVPVDR